MFVCVVCLCVVCERAWNQSIHLSRILIRICTLTLTPLLVCFPPSSPHCHLFQSGHVPLPAILKRHLEHVESRTNRINRSDDTEREGVGGDEGGNTVDADGHTHKSGLTRRRESVETMLSSQYADSGDDSGDGGADGGTDGDGGGGGGGGGGTVKFQSAKNALDNDLFGPGGQAEKKTKSWQRARAGTGYTQPLPPTDDEGSDYDDDDDEEEEEEEEDHGDDGTSAFIAPGDPRSIANDGVNKDGNESGNGANGGVGSDDAGDNDKYADKLAEIRRTESIDSIQEEDEDEEEEEEEEEDDDRNEAAYQSTQGRKISLMPEDRASEVARALAVYNAKAGEDEDEGGEGGEGGDLDLEDGWDEVSDDDGGAPYFYHAATGKTQWERPVGVVGAPPADDADDADDAVLPAVREGKSRSFAKSRRKPSRHSFPVTSGSVHRLSVASQSRVDQSTKEKAARDKAAQEKAAKGVHHTHTRMLAPW